MGIGIDKNTGVYVHIDDANSQDFKLGFTAELLGGGFQVNLGFLQLDVVNNKTAAGAQLVFDIDPGADDRVGLGELVSKINAPTFQGNITWLTPIQIPAAPTTMQWWSTGTWRPAPGLEQYTSPPNWV